MGEFLFSYSRVYVDKRDVDKWKKSLETAVSKWHGLRHSVTIFCI